MPPPLTGHFSTPTEREKRKKERERDSMDDPPKNGNGVYMKRKNNNVEVLSPKEMYTPRCILPVSGSDFLF